MAERRGRERLELKKKRRRRKEEEEEKKEKGKNGQVLGQGARSTVQCMS